jgi:50S ribosome-binding GTPase
MALARIIQIGSARGGKDGFSKKLLTDAEDVLNRAGERMRLSSSHTVVVLAGGTGSGKSSLFNRLAGADFSTVGVTRPVTREAHACIWGATGSGAMLDWLNVPVRYRYSRASALDKGEADLAGLVLLDLPDHDSVMSHSGDLVDTLVSMADVMIWVLDPQKYADAAVHRRFLVPMAGHADVLAVVLNQSDLLDPAQVDDCAADLRRLLDSENLHEVPILVTSAVSGDGVDSLRKLLVDGVVARRAAAVRIAADVDRVVTRFTPYAGLSATGSDGAAEGTGDGAAEGTGDGTAGAGDDAAGPAAEPAAQERAAAIPASAKKQLTGRFEAAAGVSAITDSLRNARELRAIDFVGWPIAWIFQRLTGREPARKVRLSMLWDDLRSVSAGPAGAQQAEIDNALTEFGDGLADPLPKPWSHTVRTAVRSRADRIPAAVGSAIGETLPAENSVRWWWRLAGLWQGLLLGLAALAVVWLIVITVFGVFHAVSGVAFALRDTAALPWIGGAGVAALALGAGTAALSMSSVRRSAERENARVATDMRGRIGEVAQEMVILPVEQELSEYDRYRDEVLIATNGLDTPADPAAERA